MVWCSPTTKMSKTRKSPCQVSRTSYILQTERKMLENLTTALLGFSKGLLYMKRLQSWRSFRGVLRDHSSSTVMACPCPRPLMRTRTGSLSTAPSPLPRCRTSSYCLPLLRLGRCTAQGSACLSVSTAGREAPHQRSHM